MRGSDDDWGYSLEYPEQVGLDFAVSLITYDDILQLEAPDFVAEFFPVDEDVVRERFVDAACGLFEGRYRLVYFRRGGRILKTQLQAPDGTGWKPKATRYASLLGLLPWSASSSTAVQNVSAV